MIVTNNLRDYPAEVLRPFDVEAWSADAFVSDLIDGNGDTVATVIARMAADNRRPPRTVNGVLDSLERHGLRRAVAELRPLLH